MANAYDFKFVADFGTITYICAQSRKEAIHFYCEEKCCNEEHVKEHCKIKNMGIIKNERY